MRGTLLTLGGLASLLLLVAAADPPGPARVENFGLLDHQGVFHELYRESQRPALVLFVQGNGCPIARKSVPALREVRDAFAPQGVVFWMINANPQDGRDEIAAEAERFGIDFPILLDEAQLVARSLGVTRTAEAIVIAPEGWRIVYRGPVDDRLSYASERPVREHWLRDALAAQLSGRPVKTPVREAQGCLIRFEDAAAGRPPSAISYARDVAPILEERCRTCHRAGGVAPWQMSDYATVRAWAPMMREAIRTGRMPPWQADPGYGHFRDDLALPARERRTLVHWIEAGAPRGSGGDPLAERPVAAIPTWPLGEPDVVIEAPVQRIPASGVVPYLYEELELPFEREVWLRGADLRPSNFAVMHHGITWLLYPEGQKAPRTEGPRFTRGLLPSYVPGLRPAFFPEGTGYRIPAGAKIRLQLHYTTTGRPETDAPRLGLYLADGPARHELRRGAVGTLDLAIPPGAEEYEVVTEHVLRRNVVVYSLSPHMHYRGKRMRYDAHYPDGRVETLLSVPRFDFNWQHQYAPDPPLRLPAGTRLVVTAAFDNSADNPRNPDPGVWVHWGEQSFDEMLFGFFLYREDGPLQTAGSGAPD
jgi:hypothetical protein